MLQHKIGEKPLDKNVTERETLKQKLPEIGQRKRKQRR